MSAGTPVSPPGGVTPMQGGLSGSPSGGGRPAMQPLSFSLDAGSDPSRTLDSDRSHIRNRRRGAPRGGSAAAGSQPVQRGDALSRLRVAIRALDGSEDAELNLDSILESATVWDDALNTRQRGGEGLCATLHHAPALKVLSFRGSKDMTRAHADRIAASLRERTDGGPSELDFGSNRLSDEGAQGVGAIIRALESLDCLRLSNVTFTSPGGLTHITQAISESQSRGMRYLDLSGLSGSVPTAAEWSSLLDVLSCTPRLDELVLANNKLCCTPLKQLALLFGARPELRFCDVSNTGHDSEARKWLFDALRERIRLSRSRMQEEEDDEAMLTLDEDVPFDHGWTDLQYAAVDGDEAQVRGALGRRAAEVHRRDAYGRTTIQLCAAGGSAPCLQALLADLQLRFMAHESLLIVNFEDRYAATALEESASRCHLECTRMLLAAGADVGTRSFEAALRLHIEHADCIAHTQKDEAARAAGLSARTGDMNVSNMRLVSLRANDAA
eukprot:Hpha_TRINITY_DN19930_c0_g1::TRINITY_DN19930_c0_g1_i1::g.93623::m.93623